MNQRQPNSKHPARRKCGGSCASSVSTTRWGALRGSHRAPIALQSVRQSRPSGLQASEVACAGPWWCAHAYRRGETNGFFIFYRHLTQESLKNLIYVLLSHPQGSLDRSKAGLPRSVRHGESLPLASSPCLMHCSYDRLGGVEGLRSQALRCPGSKQHLVSLAWQRALQASIKPVSPPANKL